MGKKYREGSPSVCQTVWIQIDRRSVGPDLGPTRLQRLSADRKNLH